MSESNNASFGNQQPTKHHSHSLVQSMSVASERSYRKSYPFTTTRLSEPSSYPFPVGFANPSVKMEADSSQFPRQEAAAMTAVRKDQWLLSKDLVKIKVELSEIVVDQVVPESDSGQGTKSDGSTDTPKASSVKDSVVKDNVDATIPLLANMTMSGPLKIKEEWETEQEKGIGKSYEHPKPQGDVASLPGKSTISAEKPKEEPHLNAGAFCCANCFERAVLEKRVKPSHSSPTMPRGGRSARRGAAESPARKRGRRIVDDDEDDDDDPEISFKPSSVTMGGSPRVYPPAPTRRGRGRPRKDATAPAREAAAAPAKPKPDFGRMPTRSSPVPPPLPSSSSTTRKSSRQSSPSSSSKSSSSSSKSSSSPAAGLRSSRRRFETPPTVSRDAGDSPRRKLPPTVTFFPDKHVSAIQDVAQAKRRVQQRARRPSSPSDDSEVHDRVRKNHPRIAKKVSSSSNRDSRRDSPSASPNRDSRRSSPSPSSAGVSDDEEVDLSGETDPLSEGSNNSKDKDDGSDVVAAAEGGKEETKQEADISKKKESLTDMNLESRIHSELERTVRVFVKHPGTITLDNCKSIRNLPCCARAEVAEDILLPYFHFAQLSSGERAVAYRDAVNAGRLGWADDNREATLYCASCAYSLESTMDDHECKGDPRRELNRTFRATSKVFPKFDNNPEETVVLVRNTRCTSLDRVSDLSAEVANFDPAFRGVTFGGSVFYVRFASKELAAAAVRTLPDQSHSFGGSNNLEAQLLVKTEGFKNIVKISSNLDPKNATSRESLEQRRRLADKLKSTLSESDPDPSSAERRSLLVLGAPLRRQNAPRTVARLRQLLNCGKILTGGLEGDRRQQGWKAAKGNLATVDYSVFALAVYDSQETATEALKSCQFHFLSNSHVNLCWLPNFLSLASERVVLPKQKKLPASQRAEQREVLRRSQERQMQDRLSVEFAYKKSPAKPAATIVVQPSSTSTTTPNKPKVPATTTSSSWLSPSAPFLQRKSMLFSSPEKAKNPKRPAQSPSEPSFVEGIPPAKRASVEQKPLTPSMNRQTPVDRSTSNFNPRPGGSTVAPSQESIVVLNPWKSITNKQCQTTARLVSSSGCQTEATEETRDRADFTENVSLPTKKEEQLEKLVDSRDQELENLRLETKSVDQAKAELAALEEALSTKRKELENFYLPSMTIKLEELDEQTLNEHDLKILREGCRKREAAEERIQEMEREAKEMNAKVLRLEETLEMEKEAQTKANEAATSLKNLLQEAQAKVSDFEKQMSEERAKQDGVKRDKDKLEENLKSMYKQLSDARAEVEVEKNNVVKLRSQCSDLDGQVASAKASASKTATELAQVRKQHQNALERIGQLESSERENCQIIRGLESRIMAVTKDRNGYQDEAKKLKKALQEVRGSETEWSSRLEAAKQEKADLAKSAQEERTEWSKKVDALKAEVAKVREEKDKSDRSVKVYMDINEKLQVKQNALREKLKVALDKAGGGGMSEQDKVFKIIDLQSKIDNYERTGRRLQEERDAAKQEVAAMRAQKVEDGVRLDEELTSMAEINRKLQEEKSSALGQAREMEVKVKEALKTMKEQREKLDSVEKDKEDKAKEVSQLTTAKEELVRKLQDAENVLKSRVDYLYEKHRKEMEDETRKITEATEKIQTLEDGEKMLRSEIKEREERIEALVQQRERQKKSGEDAETARQALFSLLTDFSETLADMDCFSGRSGRETPSELSAVRSLVADAGRRKAATTAEAASHLTGLVESLTKELQERCDAEERAAKEAVEAKDKVRGEEELRTEAEERAKKAEEEKEKLLTAEAEGSSRIEELLQKLEKAENEKQELIKKHKEQIEMTDKAHMSIASIKSSYEVAIKRQDDNLQEVRNEVQKLRGDLSKKDLEVKRAQENIAKLQQSIQRTAQVNQERSSEAESKVARLEGQARAAELRAEAAAAEAKQFKAKFEATVARASAIAAATAPSSAAIAGSSGMTPQQQQLAERERLRERQEETRRQEAIQTLQEISEMQRQQQQQQELAEQQRRRHLQEQQQLAEQQRLRLQQRLLQPQRAVRPQQPLRPPRPILPRPQQASPRIVAPAPVRPILPSPVVAAPEPPAAAQVAAPSAPSPSSSAAAPAQAPSPSFSSDEDLALLTPAERRTCDDIYKGLADALGGSQVDPADLPSIYRALYDNVVGIHSTLDGDLVRLTLNRAFHVHFGQVPEEGLAASRAFRLARQRR